MLSHHLGRHAAVRTTLINLRSLLLTLQQASLLLLLLPNAILTAPAR
jgi:hypothetical protein